MGLLTVGEIFSFSFDATFRSNVFRKIILPVTAIHYGLTILFALLVGSNVVSSQLTYSGTMDGVVYMILAALTVLIAVVQTHRLYLLDERESRGLIQTTTAGYYWSYLLAGLKLGIIYIVPLIISIFLLVSMPALGIIGMIAAITLIIYAVRWQFILPAAAIGKPMLFRQSAHHFDGHKWAYFWATFLLAVVYSLIAAVLGLIIGVGLVSSGNGLQTISLSAFVWGFLESLLTVLPSVAYAFALSYVFKHAMGGNIHIGQPNSRNIEGDD